ncbi:MAG: hypothetical protein JSW58_02360, partial [Candidatus Latescibacterota bacterium]
MKRDPHNPHPTVEDIARLIEGRLGEIDRARVVAHMRTCKGCFEKYQDSAVLQGLWETGAPGFDSTKELVRAGGHVTARDSDTVDTGRVERPSVSRSWFKRPAPVAAVAAALVFVVVGGYWLGSRDRSGIPALDPSVLTPVKAAVETASGWGPIILPGGEDGVGNNGSIYRSGYVRLDDPLNTSLTLLYEEYQRGSPSQDVAYWLVAGHVATGQIDAARDFVADARKRYPNDQRIVVVEAIVAYLDGEYDRSEKLLK